MKIAFVDDDYTALTLVSDFLEDEGYEVISVSDPEDIAETLSDYDVIIMDVMIETDRTKGLRFVLDKAQEKIITPDKLVIFVSRFGRELPVIPTLLEEIGELIPFKWFDKDLDSSFFRSLLDNIQQYQKNTN